ncbi:MAG: hypothetical protein K0R90_1761, partial [Oscillospiraceae bacterium]|nr:hypothetical protein [Oscillospiraceae bacterium]
MDIELKKHRIDRMIGTLNEMAQSEAVCLDKWLWKEGRFLTLAEADQSAAAWEDFDSNSMRWGG